VNIYNRSQLTFTRLLLYLRVKTLRPQEPDREVTLRVGPFESPEAAEAWVAQFTEQAFVGWIAPTNPRRHLESRSLESAVARAYGASIWVGARRDEPGITSHIHFEFYDAQTELVASTFQDDLVDIDIRATTPNEVAEDLERYVRSSIERHLGG
jgi:hypothetical protein